MALKVAEIERVFEEYNHFFFQDRLTLPDIAVRRMKTDLARWYAPCDEYPGGLLVMNGSVAHPWTWRSTLLHELVHIYVPDEDHEHGPKFTAECNRIGRIMGLEPCDLSESWTWPGHHELVVPVDGSLTDEWEDG